MKDLGTVEALGEWIAQAARWGQRALPCRLNVSTRLVPSKARVGRGVLTAPGKPSASSVITSILFLGGVLFLGLSSHAQPPAAKVATSGPGKDFKFPDYYPSSNGVRQLKTLVTGSEAHFVSNNMNLVRLQQPRLTNYTPEGKLEWSAFSPECTVNIATREVRGNSNLFFQTADEKLFVRGVGFLWQSNSSVLILSNQVFTRIDKSSLTNNASRKQ